MFPVKACEDDNFFCSMVSSKLKLKRNHAYYHQGQLQLYVAADLCDWCDVCVYTTCGVAVERIYPDIIRQKTCCLGTRWLFFNHAGFSLEKTNERRNGSGTVQHGIGGSVNTIGLGGTVLAQRGLKRCAGTVLRSTGS